MTAYAVIKTLLLPPGGIILLLILAFLLRGVLGRLVLFTAAAVLTLLSLPLVATLLMEPLEPYPALDPAALPPLGAQAILVLSAGFEKDAPEFGGPTLDAISLQRVRYGAYLHRATKLPVYVSGGRFAEEDPAMGDLMAQTLRDEFGVPVAGIENQSRTSWDNAAYSKPLLEHDGIRRVLLVTNAWHLPRAIEACERAGLVVIPAPTGFAAAPHWREKSGLSDWLPTAKAFNLSYYALHEHLGRVWYQIRHWTEGAPRAPAPSPA